MTNLLCTDWVTSVFYMQLGNQLWTGKWMLVNKESPLLEYWLPHIPATLKEKWVCHLDAKVYMVKALLEDILRLSVNKASLKESRTWTKWTVNKMNFLGGKCTWIFPCCINWALNLFMYLFNVLKSALRNHSGKLLGKRWFIFKSQILSKRWNCIMKYC